MVADRRESVALMLEFTSYLHDARHPLTSKAIQVYLRGVRRFISWYEAAKLGGSFCVDHQIPFVTSEDLIAYSYYLTNNLNLSTPTVDQELVAVRVFWRWLCKRYSGQAGNIPKPSSWPPKRATRWLSHDEEQRLCTVLRRSKSERDIALVELLLGTGLRTAEVLKLTLSDVSLDADSPTLLVGKDPVERRVIPLSQMVRSALLDYLAVARPIDSKEPHLFLTKTGRPLRYAVLHNVIAKYARQARIVRCTAVTLRYTFAKRQVEAGVSMAEVTAMLGVTQISL